MLHPLHVVKIITQLLAFACAHAVNAVHDVDWHLRNLRRVSAGYILQASMGTAANGNQVIDTAGIDEGEALPSGDLASLTHRAPPALQSGWPESLTRHDPTTSRDGKHGASALKV
jgi:hypothetical protein